MGGKRRGVSPPVRRLHRRAYAYCSEIRLGKTTGNGTIFAEDRFPNATEPIDRERLVSTSHIVDGFSRESVSVQIY